MRILVDNVDVFSNSGPSSFGRALIAQLGKENSVSILPPGRVLERLDVDLHLAFISSQVRSPDVPLVQRLDGVWFNTEQDWKNRNSPLIATYRDAAAVIAQSQFDRDLIERFFGHHPNMSVIHNGVDVNVIRHALVDTFWNGYIGRFIKEAGYREVWCCASHWRPHKRLDENIEYFRRFAPPDACLVVAGDVGGWKKPEPRVMWAGELGFYDLIALFKASSTFLHLAFLDHCPNVVLQAKECGCQIVCSSSGGTHEIAGVDALVIDEDPWDFEPLPLYRPPKLDFDRQRKNGVESMSRPISDVGCAYMSVFEEVIK